MNNNKPYINTQVSIDMMINTVIAYLLTSSLLSVTFSLLSIKTGKLISSSHERYSSVSELVSVLSVSNADKNETF